MHPLWLDLASARLGFVAMASGVALVAVERGSELGQGLGPDRWITQLDFVGFYKEKRP
jgi:hypothetical protein